MLDSEELQSEYELIRNTANRLWANVDALMEDWNVRMIYNPRTYAKVNGVAALGHLCHFAEVLIDVSEDSSDSLVATLLIRNFIETWALGLCLVLGNEDELSKYLAMVVRLEETDLKEFDAMRAAGVIGKSFPRPKKNFDLNDLRNQGYQVGKMQLWQFKAIFERAVHLLRECGLADGGDSLYGFVYRQLSNRLGAHPSPYLFDRYFDTRRFFVEYSRSPSVHGPGFDETVSTIKNCWIALQFTTIYALAIALSTGASRSALDGVMVDTQHLSQRWIAKDSESQN